jgi:peptidoglycan/LPS O-acetylase OafA/YrhL
MRRVTRLEPPYIASLLLAFLGYALYWHGLNPGFAGHALASLFYQHSLVFGQLSVIDPVTWSLEVEIQFYILAPLAMQCFRIRPVRLRRALLLAGILGISLAQIPFQNWPRVEMSILFYLQYFLMGLLAADIFVLDLAKIKSSWIWDLAGAAALWLVFCPPFNASWSHALMPIPIGVLCLAAMRSHLLRAVFANRWVAITGGMCYSIYLLHFVLIAFLFKATRHAIVPHAIFAVNLLIQILLLVPATVAICAVFFLLVERPCMDPNWPSKLWHALTGRRGVEVAMLDAGGI